MKNLLFVTLMLLVQKIQAQMYAEFAVGISNVKSPVVNPAVGYNIHNAFIQADMIPVTNQDQPVYFGLRGGYNFFVGDFGVQGFAGRYRELYTTDKEDAYRNRWRYMFGMKLYYKKVFIQAQSSDMNIFSFGLTEKFSIN